MLAACRSILFSVLATTVLLANSAGELKVHAQERVEGEPEEVFDPSAEQYVAVGQLRRYGAARRGRMRYVLVDQLGEITCHVTPVVDVNLRAYLGKQIGVTARAKTYRQGRPPHILAERVTLLEGTGADPIQPASYEALEHPRTFTDLVNDFDDSVATADYRAPLYDYPPVMAPHAPFRVSPRNLLPRNWFPASGTFGSDPNGLMCCGQTGWYWVQVDFLAWWMDGMDLPPLVTTSAPGVAQADAGVLGLPTTSTLFGSQEFLNNSRPGGRVLLGGWIDSKRLWGVEGDYFGLSKKTKQFLAGSDGSQILARPFFNIHPTVLPAREDAELISFPGLIAGSVAVTASNSFHSGGVRMRVNLCCDKFGYATPCVTGCSQFSSVDFLLGYRYVRLKEWLMITEDSQSLDPLAPQQFDIFDRFETRNEFHGVEVGTAWQRVWHRWTGELIAKMALGNVRQQVIIDGGTTITPIVGPSSSLSGGVLAQRSNAGGTRRDEFAMVPEIDLKFGYKITPRVQATLGYTFLYISRVVRPGEQIDRDLNPDLLPPEAVPFTGPLRPTFAFHDTDFWAHGLNFGLDYRW